MTLHIETVYNPKVTRTTVGRLAEDAYYEHDESERDDDILLLEYDEAVVITGDLEAFARDVWKAVFGAQPPTDQAADRTWYTCVDCDSGDMTEEAARWHQSHAAHVIEALGPDDERYPAQL